ncbi:hypothetical protein D9619_010523 [Psilocybe cf. subviscida]|uniref:Uncharacterized protein n=1 Tax=Psilocybe cf. subviscida TaxID=2480587 RepID=A0A8H5ARS3_9AGAR|nr:hypothetical protein D9619_010523 [Psilocybe cf. subviscida]
MPLNPKVHPTNPYEDPEPGKIGASKSILQGGAMILDLVQQASKLTSLPYLSDAAGLALKLVQIAQAVKENKEGFQQLADTSTRLVAAFYRSYQGARNQDEWVNSDGIRTAAKDLERCLFSINTLGEKMKARGLVRRILCCVIDANAIKKYRQRLSSATTQFEAAAGFNMRDVLDWIEKKQDELLDEVRHLIASSGTEISIKRAIENENRARERIQIEDVEFSGIAFGPGSVVVENGRAPGGSGSGSSTPKSQQNKQRSAIPSPSPGEMGGVPTRPDIKVKGVHSSGIAFGDGGVSVSNQC